MRHTVPLLLATIAAAQPYQPGPDSMPQPGVPHGALTSHKHTSTRIFPGSTRDYSVYVPAQYKTDSPACVMVFQDGTGFVAPNSATATPASL